MNARYAILAAALLTTMSGCASSSENAGERAESTGTQSSAWSTSPYSWWFQPEYQMGAMSFNLYGRDLNGRSLNGTELTGHGALGESLTNVRVRGKLVSGVTLDGTTFKVNGREGRDFTGATFDAVLDNGATLPVRIDAIDHNPSESLRDVLLYAVSYEADDAWRPFCGVDADGKAVKAIPLSGRWDYRQGVAGGGAKIADASAFTFACEGYALAKCVDLGYRPWVNGRACASDKCPQISLSDVHQTCTRAMRADYCGDGTSYTNNGELIDLFDKYAINWPSPGWRFEAEWDQNGARCAKRQRVPERGVPTCWANLQSASCGSPLDFFRGTLMMTQDAP